MAHVEQAVRLVRQAVVQDSKRNYAEASRCYKEAILSFSLYVGAGGLSHTLVDAINSRISEYEDRLRVIDRHLLAQTDLTKLLKDLDVRGTDDECGSSISSSSTTTRHLYKNPHLVCALDSLRRGRKADERRNLRLAVSCYEAGLSTLLDLVNKGQLTPRQESSAREKCLMYHERVQLIKEHIEEGKFIRERSFDMSNMSLNSVCDSPVPDTETDNLLQMEEVKSCSSLLGSSQSLNQSLEDATAFLHSPRPSFNETKDAMHSPRPSHNRYFEETKDVMHSPRPANNRSFEETKEVMHSPRPAHNRSFEETKDVMHRPRPSHNRSFEETDAIMYNQPIEVLRTNRSYRHDERVLKDESFERDESLELNRTHETLRGSLPQIFKDFASREPVICRSTHSLYPNCEIRRPPTAMSGLSDVPRYVSLVPLANINKELCLSNGSIKSCGSVKSCGSFASVRSCASIHSRRSINSSRSVNSCTSLSRKLDTVDTIESELVNLSTSTENIKDDDTGSDSGYSDPSPDGRDGNSPAGSSTSSAAADRKSPFSDIADEIAEIVPHVIIQNETAVLNAATPMFARKYAKQRSVFQNPDKDILTSNGSRDNLAVLDSVDGPTAAVRPEVYGRSSRAEPVPSRAVATKRREKEEKDGCFYVVAALDFCWCL